MKRPVFKNPGVEVSRLLGGRLHEIHYTLEETALLTIAQDAVTKEPKFQPLLSPIIELALPGCFWTVEEWEAAVSGAKAELADIEKAGNQIDRFQAELARRALLRLCAEYDVVRRMGTKACKAWLLRRTMIEALALATMEGIEAWTVKILGNLVSRKIPGLNPPAEDE